MAQQQARTDLELEANEETKGLHTLPMGPAALTSARPAWPSRACIPLWQMLSGKEKGWNVDTCTLLAARSPALTSPLLTAWRACKLVACGITERGTTKPKLVLLGAAVRSALITAHIIDMITIDLTNGMIADEGTDMDVGMLHGMPGRTFSAACADGTPKDVDIRECQADMVGPRQATAQEVIYEETPVGIKNAEVRTYEHPYLLPLNIINITPVCGTKMCNLALTSPCPHMRRWRACTPVALGALRTMPTEVTMAVDPRTPPALAKAIINSSPYDMDIDARRYTDEEAMSVMPGGC